MLDVVVARDAGYVAMHHGGQPRTRPYRRSYRPDVTTAVSRTAATSTDRALAAGVPAGRLIVDPGHDFQKTTAHSLELSRRLPELAALGFPVLVALSNKDFVGETLDAPLERRGGGTGGAWTDRWRRRSSRSCAAPTWSGSTRCNAPSTRSRMTEALLGWRRPAVEVRGLE